MISNCYIKQVVVLAKCCSSRLAGDYVSSANYGYKESERAEKLEKMLRLKAMINCLEKYYVPTKEDFIENGVLNYRGAKIILSKNNSLSLQSDGKKLAVSSEDVNCISEEELCSLIRKIESFCSECS